MSKRKTREEFIEEARAIHDDKYDYSKVVYINNNTDIIIICSIHKDFPQKPNSHLAGHGCKECGHESTKNLISNTKEEFIEKARKVHGNKYDYSKVEYINNSTEVIITCPIHDDFPQKPNSHLCNRGCKKCGIESSALSRRKPLEVFIKEANIIHGNKYDYSKVNYINGNTDITIICPIHDEFKKIPDNHLDGQGCQKCSGKYIDTEIFIERARKIHGKKYDYSKSIYINSDIDIIIKCSIHDEFLQMPYDHLGGCGCQKCANENKAKNQTSTKEEYIEKARKIHGDKYDYSKLIYINANMFGTIICPIHKEFTKLLSSHLQGIGCPECGFEKIGDSSRSNTGEFIEKARKVHGNKYDYSLVNYINCETTIKIICPIHKEFPQLPSVHLHGSGCPTCNESKGEKEIANFLMNKNINFIRQYKFDNCKHKQKLPFDFYLPKYNICIEFDGIQHFKIIKGWGGESKFNELKINDNIKTEYCKNNNIELIRIRYNENIIDILNNIKF